MTTVNVIEAFRAKMAEAKQAQAASGQNKNLRDFVGQQMVVTGMHITEGIEIDNLVIDKATFFLADGTAIDGFHAVAVDRAEELIEVLGEGPYPLPLLMEVCEMETKKRGVKQYAKLLDFAAAPGEVSFAELEAENDLDPEEKTITETPAPEKPLTRAQKAAAKKAAEVNK